MATYFYCTRTSSLDHNQFMYAGGFDNARCSFSRGPLRTVHGTSLGVDRYQIDEESTTYILAGTISLVCSTKSKRLREYRHQLKRWLHRWPTDLTRSPDSQRLVYELSAMVSRAIVPSKVPHVEHHHGVPETASPKSWRKRWYRHVTAVHALYS